MQAEQLGLNLLHVLRHVKSFTQYLGTVPCFDHVNMPLGAADDYKAIWITLESTLQRSLTNRINNLISYHVPNFEWTSLQVLRGYNPQQVK